MNKILARYNLSNLSSYRNFDGAFKRPLKDPSIVFGLAQVVKEAIEILAPANISTSIPESRAGPVSTKVFGVFL